MNSYYRHPDFGQVVDDAKSAEYWAHRCGIAEGECLRRDGELRELREQQIEGENKVGRLEKELYWKQERIKTLEEAPKIRTGKRTA